LVSKINGYSFKKVFSPISKILVNWSDILEKRLERRYVSSAASKTDIDEAINLTVTDGIHSAGEIDILKSIIHFGDVSVKQIMKARVDVLALDFKTNYKKLLKVIVNSNYSRIPVYTEDLDHITGILYAKDLLGHLQEKDDFEWQKLLRTEMLYVPEAKKIDDLLKEFQARRIDDYNYLFEGKTLLNDACRVVGLDTNAFDEYRGDADSLAGLILEIRGRFPKKGMEILTDSCTFKVTAVNKKRIEQIQLTLVK